MEEIEKEEEIGRAELLSGHYIDGGDELGNIEVEGNLSRGLTSESQTSSEAALMEKDVAMNRFEMKRNDGTTPIGKVSVSLGGGMEEDGVNDDSSKDVVASNKNLQDEIHKLAHVSLGDDLTVSTYSQLRIRDESKSISSLQSMPSTNNSDNVIGTKQQQQQLFLTMQSALGRPFGRAGLPLSAKRCHVQINSREWDAVISRWKYMISICDDHPLSVLGGGWSNQPTSLIAKTTRTLQDFAWLEQSLRQEYNGGLVLPLLSLALNNYITSNEVSMKDAVPLLDFEMLEKSMDKNGPVNERFLADWLSDVLNSVRGQGEFILKTPDVLICESVETFLYRNIDTTDKPDNKIAIGKETIPLIEDKKGMSSSTMSTASRSSRLGDGCPNFFEEGLRGNTAIPNFLWRPFSCFGSPDSNVNEKHPTKSSSTFPLPLEMISCSSRSKINESTASSSKEWSNTPSAEGVTKMAIHSEIIEVQQNILTSYNLTTTTCLNKLRLFLEEESQRMSAWKRLAISLSNLFSLEKDVENSRVALKDSSKKKKKLSKSCVDDRLRILARSKQDRSFPSLNFLGGMLNGHSSVLYSIRPSLETYSHAVSKLASMSLEEPQDEAEQSRILFEKQVLENEDLLIKTLQSFCLSTNIRMARMSYKFFEMEATQASSLLDAANELHSKLDTFEEEELLLNKSQEDDTIELQLVQQLIDIGQKQNLNNSQGDRYSLSTEALTLAKERLGRWDAELALSIMEAAGVEDAEVSVEETTRDLRLVRKYAISLRNCLERCIEAVEALIDVYHTPQAKSKRQEFGSSLAIIFSGCWSTLTSNSSISRNSSTYHQQPDSPSNTNIANTIGIDTSDRPGWLGAVISTSLEEDLMLRSMLEKRSPILPENNNNPTRGHCGRFFKNYQKFLETRTCDLLQDISTLLEQYETRVEGIESFVYMHCVGIQLEKHFSKNRKEALAAWEKKTDITTAINIAQRKRLPLLVNELKAKLESYHHVSHTTVKLSKERHLASKTLKTELQILANRRFQTLKDMATHRVMNIVRCWAHFEQTTQNDDLKLIQDLLSEIQRNVTHKDIDADGGAHLFASAADAGNVPR